MRTTEIQPVRLVSSTERAAFAPRQKSAGEAPKARGDVEVERSSLLDAEAPPIDTQRIAQIRAAIGNGSYELKPAAIADAMIAAFQAPRTS